MLRGAKVPLARTRPAADEDVQLEGRQPPPDACERVSTTDCYAVRIRRDHRHP